MFLLQKEKTKPIKELFYQKTKPINNKKTQKTKSMAFFLNKSLKIRNRSIVTI
jgi:hypothetical protein